jgi:RND family efflux transporter MFP subunit
MAPRLAPVLALKRREARSAWSKALHGMGDRTRVLLGGGYVRFKLSVAFILAIVAGLLFIQTDRQVSAPSSIEGQIQQVVAAPFAGYIKEAHVRAGDQVTEGQALLRIDDRELLLDQEKLTSERDKQAREYQEALAGRERAKVSVIRAQIEQTEARLRLIDDRLARAVLRAPFAGTVVSGDLSRSLGAPIERGQSLFELVPDAGFRVTMQVDEYDVADLEPGQTGHLRLAGLPTAPVPITVSRVVPIADAAQGTNQFRVEGEIPQPPGDLRPGMQGVAKVVVGEGSLLRVWTHSLVRRLQLWFWSIGF